MDSHKRKYRVAICSEPIDKVSLRPSWEGVFLDTAYARKINNCL